MSQQIMITITYALVKLIIMILKAKEKIREVEYFDLELECRQRIMGENQIFTRQVVRNCRGVGLRYPWSKEPGTSGAGRKAWPSAAL